MGLLSVILVNYKSTGLLLDCLQSIYVFPSARTFEIIVVDNASGDGGQETAFGRFPEVKWIQLDRNEGFARANNAGIRAAKGDAVLLLNTDTLIIDDAVSRAYALLMQSDHLACGVQLLNPDGSPQISGNYFMRGSLNNLLPLPYLGNLAKAVGQLAGIKKTNVPEAASEVKVDWINGAFLMVKSEAIRKVGLLDEEFFLYAEEAEWCSRIGKFGSQCIYGSLHVTHLQGATSNEAFGSSGHGYGDLSDRKGLQIMLSNFVRIRKQYGAGWFLFHLFMYTIDIPVLWIIGSLSGLWKPGKYALFFKKARGFTSNVASLWSYAATILFRRPCFYKVL